MIAFVAAFAAAGTWSGSPLVGLLAGLAAGVGSVWFYPTTSCWWCGPRGSSRVTDARGTSWRNCQVCGGSGRRKRVLARVIGGIDD